MHNYVTEISGAKSNAFFVKYRTSATTGKNSKKKVRWVDFELPPAEKTSWWRVDGYGTLNEESEEAADATGEEDADDDSEGCAMDVDESD